MITVLLFLFLAFTGAVMSLFILGLILAQITRLKDLIGGDLGFIVSTSLFIPVTFGGILGIVIEVGSLIYMAFHGGHLA